MVEQRNPFVYFIGHVNDPVHRFKASSGGIGTLFQKHLLSTGQYGTSITFQFNAEKCMYEAKLIHTAEEVNICGSIYQDINIANFVRDHIRDISNGIVVSCPPCQVTAIRNMLKKEGIPCFIISFCCSGQTTIEGTWKYYELLGIKKEDVVNMQYRGNGWPSGIQIELNNGIVIRKSNYTYPWNLLHQSLLFRPKRCLSCSIKTSPNADVSLADPWLKEYIENDEIGNTVVICNNVGSEIIRKMQDTLVLKDIDEYTYIKSQRGTIQTKSRARLHKRYNKIVGLMGKDGSLYRKIATSSATCLKLHIKILYVLQRCLNNK